MIKALIAAALVFVGLQGNATAQTIPEALLATALMEAPPMFGDGPPRQQCEYAAPDAPLPEIMPHKTVQTLGALTGHDKQIGGAYFVGLDGEPIIWLSDAFDFLMLVRFYCHELKHWRLGHWHD